MLFADGVCDSLVGLVRHDQLIGDHRTGLWICHLIWIIYLFIFTS